MLDRSKRDYDELWKNLNQPDPFKWVNDEIYSKVWLGAIRTGYAQITDEFGRIFELGNFFEYYPAFNQGKPRWRDTFPKRIVLTEKLRFKSFGLHNAETSGMKFRNELLDIPGNEKNMNYMKILSYFGSLLF